MGGGSNAGGKGGGGGGRGKGGQDFTDWRCSLGQCSFWNYGWRTRCKVCEARPPAGARIPKGSSKGTASGIGGIAQRQLRQQADEQRKRQGQSEMDKMRAEHQRAIERMQRQLDAARRGEEGPVEVDMDEGDGGDDNDDEGKEATLQSERRHAENLLKGLADVTSPFKESAQMRGEVIRKELERIREQRGGPEAKILGMAGRHARELRTTRATLLRKTRAQAKLEEEVDDVAKEVEEAQSRLEEKKKKLAEVKAEVQLAKASLEKLFSKTGGGDEGDEAGTAVEAPMGPQARANALMEQLAAHLPPPFKTQLQAVVAAASLAAQQAKAEAEAAEAAAEQHRMQQQQQRTDPGTTGDEGEWGSDMADLDESTVELLDLLDGTAGEQGDKAEVEAGGREATGKGAQGAIRRKGATRARIQAVIKDLKGKKLAKPTAATDSKKGGGCGSGGSGKGDGAGDGGADEPTTPTTKDDDL